MKMKYAFSSSSAVLALLVTLPASAADWYVSPTGTLDTASACPTRATPCSLASAAAGAVAGDTVYLTSGSYQQALFVANSGTASAPDHLQSGYLCDAHHREHGLSGR